MEVPSEEPAPKRPKPDDQWRLERTLSVPATSSDEAQHAFDAVKGKETITTGMSESDDFGQIGLQRKGHEFVHHGGVVGVSQIHEVLIIPLDHPGVCLGFGHIDPFRPALELPFDVPDRGQIFLELFLIGTG